MIAGIVTMRSQLVQKKNSQGRFLWLPDRLEGCNKVLQLCIGGNKGLSHLNTIFIHIPKCAAQLPGLPRVQKRQGRNPLDQDDACQALFSEWQADVAAKSSTLEHELLNRAVGWGAGGVLRALMRKLGLGALKRRMRREIRRSVLRKRVRRVKKRARIVVNSIRRSIAMRRVERPPRPSVRILKAEYCARGLNLEPDSFVLYRILGNDLYPRHKQGQTIENLRFTLEHEPPLEACEKRWVVNRIFDADQENAIMRLLNDHKQKFLHIPFDWEAYGKIGWNWESFPEPGFFQGEWCKPLPEAAKARAEVQLRRLRNIYVMNNNGARNAALSEGRSLATWILPWDGNCFLTTTAWKLILNAVRAQPYLKYFTVPMARITDNAILLQEGFAPPAEEEPQILFRRDSLQKFDERYPYGRRPKVELLCRLGVPVTSWGSNDPWDLPRPSFGPEAGQFGSAGWVARLNSGHPHLENGTRSLKDRDLARTQAIRATLDGLNNEVVSRKLEASPLLTFADAKVATLKRAHARGSLHRADSLSAFAQKLRPPLSAALIQSLTRRHYPPAVTFTITGTQRLSGGQIPIRLTDFRMAARDGDRLPGTNLYEPGCERYDRTSGGGLLMTRRC